MNRDGADADGNFVSGFVVEESSGLDGVRSFDGAGDGAIFAAEFATGLVAVQQSFGDAGVADDLVAQEPCDALGAIAPEDDLFLHVDDAEAGGHAVEDAAANLGVVECGHGW